MSSIAERFGRRPLDAFFRPESVAVIGATDRPGSVGRSVLWNLVSNTFGGTVYPVNPNRASVLGIRAYATVADVPERVDLAVIATPALSVPGVVGACAAAGITAAVILSAGFKEVGAAGVELERQVLAEARRGRMRLLGPNCLGIMAPNAGLNASFASATALPGNVGFASQSGALCSAILDWSLTENVGFSAFISLGSMIDVTWADLIGYLGDDGETHSIVLYIESVRDPRQFLSAAREVALAKPIIVIKPGRTEATAQAAASHTGALVARDDVLDAAFRRCGVLRVNSIADLFNMADVLAKQPRPAGKRLAIVTNAGGPGLLAADALVMDGGELAALSNESTQRLDVLLPPHWSHGNPVDVLGDATADAYAGALQVVADDPGVDGLLVILAPEVLAAATPIADRLKSFASLRNKPILASWMGGAEVAAGAAALKHAGIPTFAYPDTAARAFNYMWRYRANLAGLYETPALPPDGEAPDRAGVRAIVGQALARGRTLLTEYETNRVLAAYGIATVPTTVALTADEAVRAADAIGYPVAVKLHSETIARKSEVGGVRLRVRTAWELVRAYDSIADSVRSRAGDGHFLGVVVQPMLDAGGYELLLGSSLDEQFGPVVAVGLGGRLVEVLRDRALALPPLTTTLARRTMEQTRIFRALEGIRGQAPVDLDGLAQTMVQFSTLIVEHRRIREIEINPLLVTPDRIVALDARATLHPAEVADDALPQSAIRPYPRKYVGEFYMNDGRLARIRPIRPEDEPLVRHFHEGLSDLSVYRRFVHALRFENRIAHERLVRVCFIDYDREMALIALVAGPSGEDELAGVGRLIKDRQLAEAEFAVLIRDSFQRQGLGGELLRRLVEVGRAESLDRIVGYILPENVAMLRAASRLGFTIEQRLGDMSMARIELA